MKTEPAYQASSCCFWCAGKRGLQKDRSAIALVCADCWSHQPLRTIGREAVKWEPMLAAGLDDLELQILLSLDTSNWCVFRRNELVRKGTAKAPFAAKRAAAGACAALLDWQEWWRASLEIGGATWGLEVQADPKGWRWDVGRRNSDDVAERHGWAESVDAAKGAAESVLAEVMRDIASNAQAVAGLVEGLE